VRGLPQPPILVISDRRQAALPLEELALDLLASGCRWFSLREKDLSRREQAKFVTDLLPAFDEVGAVLCLHADDADLAAELGLQALHLSRAGNPGEARRRMGEGALIGLSCHSEEALERAAAQGVDYATLSPIFESASKPGYAALSGGEAERLLAEAPLPVLALGGVEDPEKAKACRALGAAGLAVMGSVMRSGAPGETFAALATAWRDAA
jgi:thiamine-phosphate pyrophosphorylase